MPTVHSILVVEDHTTTRKMLRFALMAEGYAVVEAPDARAALAAAEESLPDLILQDLILPDMDGLELLHRLRALPGGTELPILAVSGFLSRLEEAQTDQQGFTAVLVKPIEPSRLIDTVRLYLGQPRALAASLGERTTVGILASRLSLLSGVADALTRQSDPDVALQEVLAATLDAAGIAKGALVLRDTAGVLELRHHIGFSEEERSRLQSFLGHGSLLEDIVNLGASVPMPSPGVPADTSRDILTGANVAAQIVPLVSDGRRVGAMIIGTSREVTTDDSIAFARAMGNQIVQSAELARAVTRLTASEQRYRTLLESASDFIAVLSPDGVVREMNHRWVGLTGLPRERLIGRRIRDLVHRGKENENVQIYGDGVPVSAVPTPPVEIVSATGSKAFIEFSSTNVDVGGERLVFTIGRDVTERRRAEAQSRLQSAALNAAANAMVITDREGIIEWVNPAFSELTGYTAAEAVGRNPRDLVKSDQHDHAFYKDLWDTILSGQVWRGEIINRRKDGSLYAEEQTITPLRDPHGAISHFIDVKRDITERRRAEQEVTERAQVSALGAAVGLALADNTTLAHALQRCAEALVAHLGATVARIWTFNQVDGVLDLRASAGLYTPLNDPQGSIPLGHLEIGRIARDRKPHVTNTVIGDPQVSDQDWARREGLVAFAGHPLMLDDRVVGVMALFARRPLSDAVIEALASVADHVALGVERHRGADALRLTEDRMRFALKNADVGIWDMDYTTGVLRWSETLEAHYGLRPGAFGGTFEAFVECVHPDDRASLLDTLGKAMTAGGEFSVQNRSIWPDGTIRWLSGTGRVLLGEHGEPVRAVGISLDVTGRRTLEEQYQQAQKMEAIGRLAGGVAHDFNNLLTVILGFCELLLEDLNPTDPGRVEIAEIQKAGMIAAALTRQLLAFSRKQIIEPALLDLNVVVAGMRAMLARLIGEDVTVVLNLRPNLALVKADRGQVEQIVMNLAVNARDAMPQGGRLTIETADVDFDQPYAKTHPSVTAGPHVTLTVTDTGTGMTPQVQARLFEPFFTTKEAGKGTGLGLATVHGIVARSGGSVSVSSEVGRGSSFRVCFPRADAAEGDVAAPPPINRRRAEGQTVLVVEDAEGLRELTMRLLQRHGYTVLVAANADEALRLFEQHPSIALVLTDVVMPGTSGPELTRRLVGDRRALRVIYMSGYTEEAIVQHGILKPGIAFLHKPFTSETLIHKIREVLDR